MTDGNCPICDGKDVPALQAEVDRLRAEVAQLRLERDACASLGAMYMKPEAEAAVRAAWPRNH